MSFIPALFQAAGNVIQGVGAYKQAQDQAEAYQYNAGLSEVHAKETEFAGALEADRIKKVGASVNSTQRMMYAKAGVMNTGSALDVAVKSQAQVEMDQFISEYNTAIAARDYRAQATQERKAASGLRTSGTISLIGGILGAGGNIANYYAQKS